jgi:ribulose-phosphate 3-epimerase
MSAIVPAILPTSLEDLSDKLAKLSGHTDRVQIDIVDGHFAAPATWPYTADGHAFNTEVAAGGLLPNVGEFQFEIDVMVRDPEIVSGIWIDAGASTLTLHVESTRYLAKAVNDLRTIYGHDKGFAPNLLSVGLALNIDTDTNILEPYIDQIDYVQFMGIARIGHQGEPFDPRVLRKIKAFRTKHPEMLIQVDGGVSLNTAPELLSVGVSRLVVGSDLWKAPDLDAELLKFKELLEQYGLYQ